MNWSSRPKPTAVFRYDGKRVQLKSKNEAAWAEHLNMLHRAGEIYGWQYEPREFTFPQKKGVTCYRPDFRVQYPDGSDVWFECKVSLVQRDIVKFKRMAKYYPGEPLVLVMPRRTKNVKARLMIAEAEKYIHRTVYRSEACSIS